MKWLNLNLSVLLLVSNLMVQSLSIAPHAYRQNDHSVREMWHGQMSEQREGGSNFWQF